MIIVLICVKGSKLKWELNEVVSYKIEYQKLRNFQWTSY